MGRGLDVAVAGCGPAGLAVALLLHRDGHRVTLFERFETPRPLGSGLMIQPTGQSVLDALGLGRIRDIGAPIERLIGHAVPSGRTALSVRYAALGRRAGTGLGVHRASLFNLLFETVQAEAIPMETGRAIAACEGGRLVFEDGGGAAGPFDLVIDALDLYARLRSGHVRLYQAISQVFTPAYQSDGRALPWLRDAMVGTFAWLWPAPLIQAVMVSGILGSPLTPLGL